LHLSSKTEETDNIIEKFSSKTIVLVGFLTLFAVTAAALLHANEPEFITDRFIGLTELEYSFFDSVLYTAYLIFGIISYIISDKRGKRRFLIGIGAVGSSIFFILMTTTLNYMVLLIYRFIQGAFTVMCWQMLMTLVLDYSGPTNKGKNMGLYGVFLALAMGLGPMVGGFIAAVDVFAPYFAASILSFLVFPITMIGLRDPVIMKKRNPLSQSIESVREHPKLVVPCIFNFIDRLHMGFLLTALPLFIVQILDLSESLRGMALGLFAMPFIILQYPMGKLSDKYGRYPQLILGSAIYGVILSTLGFFGSFGFTYLILVLLLLGLFSGVTAPAAMALIGDTVGKEDSAMAMGFFNFLGNIGMVIGPIVFGVLVLYSDFVFAFLIAGVIELVSLGIVLGLIKGKFKESIRTSV
jgi:MFS family permease